MTLDEIITHDTPESRVKWEKIYFNLFGDDISDDEIWQHICEQDEFVLLNNLYMKMLLQRIVKRTEADYPGIRCSFSVNSRDSHLYVEGTAIYTVSDYETAVAGYAAWASNNGQQA